MTESRNNVHSIVVLLVMTSGRLFNVDGAGEERCVQFMCAGIGQDVVLSIPSGWCDVGGSWNPG